MHIYKQIYPHTHTPTCDLFTTTKARQAELVMLFLWVCNGRNTVQLTVSQPFGKGGHGVFLLGEEKNGEDGRRKILCYRLQQVFLVSFGSDVSVLVQKTFRKRVNR